MTLLPTTAMPTFTSKPWLLYAYPWQPYPRRLVIYLRERNIPSSLVTVVNVSDVQFGAKVPAGFPPKPPGSLPILAIPKEKEPKPPTQGAAAEFLFIKQSIAIMEFLEEACNAGRYGFPKLDAPLALPLNEPLPSAGTTGGIAGDTEADAASRALLAARHSELLSLANGLTETWNPVRTFGSGTGTMRIPTAAKEMLGWTRRGLLAVENWFEENRYDGGLRYDDDGNPGKRQRQATIAEIVLFQFLEFTDYCYGVDMTRSSGKTVVDVYGREVVEDFPRLRRFYEEFATRPSVRRCAEVGDVPHERWVGMMRDWSEGIFEGK
ncbi:uncharacterized protein DSM5745_10505 [Aspergillus mulundensis]|uniref:GST N-terminal domain-containing protein n=1 Tax=Aspergillus mulundensis TaxID=1810919 RepID=A0A3D8QJ35_9EURO|nr:Uncharacterized protein DSM5745_10505 [Aspergillus mulundensis]RDW61833.1 Uncharacterized protein DSM5745_10505 [Aspergillus mulundensis]